MNLEPILGTKKVYWSFVGKEMNCPIGPKRHEANFVFRLLFSTKFGATNPKQVVIP